MNITIAKGSGFCPGVKRADSLVYSLVRDKKSNERIYTLGHLIHNPIYNEELKNKGVYSIEFFEVANKFYEQPQIPMTLVIRTHGIPKEQNEALLSLEEKEENFHLVDATCGYVKAIHKIADENTNEDTVFLLFCNPTHPEAVGIMSYAHGEKYAITCEEDIYRIHFGNKIPILCSQTTQGLTKFIKIKKLLKKLYTNAKIFDTICIVTENRQNESVCLSRNSDLVIVIGGKESSNTRKLYELCKEQCPNTHLVESPEELVPNLLYGVQNIGIIAGASTPDDIITEVSKTMENFTQLLEGSLKSLHTGDTVVGTIFTIGENEIKLDLGAKFTGVLAKEQVTDDPNANLSEMFKVGEEIEVFVIRVEDGKGLATVSKKRVDKDNSWVVLRDAYEAGETLEGKVVSVIKGGVLVSTGNNTVFVPASQTGIAKGGDLSVLVGTTQKIRLIEFNTEKKKALGSIKVILNEEKKALEDAVWASLEVGQHFMGTVKNLAPYGAFVDIGGVDGMVHNTELSWKRIKHPSQVVKVGQVIDVFVKELDTENKRISLGYKTQEMDSWFQFTQKYAVGDIVPAKIVSIMPFGAFAEVYPEVDGLIHISRISTERINSPADVLTVGQVVDVKITEIDDENRKLALSIRAITEAAEKAAREAAKAQEEAERAAAEAEEEARLAEERADMAPYIVGSID